MYRVPDDWVPGGLCARWIVCQMICVPDWLCARWLSVRWIVCQMDWMVDMLAYHIYIYMYVDRCYRNGFPVCLRPSVFQFVWLPACSPNTTHYDAYIWHLLPFSLSLSFSLCVYVCVSPYPEKIHPGTVNFCFHICNKWLYASTGIIWTRDKMPLAEQTWSQLKSVTWAYLSFASTRVERGRPKLKSNNEKFTSYTSLHWQFNPTTLLSSTIIC